MIRSDIELIKKPKSLNYIDAETGNYVQYECTLKVNESDLHDFYNSLHRMKLDSSAMPSKPLKDGKTTTDLVNEFKGILSSDVISFEKIVNLFNHNNVQDKRVIQAPVIKFLDLFDMRKKGEYTDKELGSIIRATKEPAFRNCTSIHKTIKELHSIATNTKLLNYKEMTQKQVKNKVYSK